MKTPADVYTKSKRNYQGLHELTYPLHDREITVTQCGRICLYRKKINLSTVFAGQTLGICEVEDGIWLVSFMQYDLGYIELEEKTLQPAPNPFNINLLPICPVRTIAQDEQSVGKVIANFRQVAKQGSLRIHPLIAQLVNKDVLEKLGAKKMGD